jgi:hypothetical protein
MFQLCALFPVKPILNIKSLKEGVTNTIWPREFNALVFIMGIAAMATGGFRRF